MTSTVFTVFMPVALGLVMFGLGLTLTVADFARVLKYPKEAAGALTCELVRRPARGDGARNITLTAINSLLSALALPVVVALATWRFMGDQAAIGLQLGKFV